MGLRISRPAPSSSGILSNPSSPTTGISTLSPPSTSIPLHSDFSSESNMTGLPPLATSYTIRRAPGLLNKNLVLSPSERRRSQADGELEDHDSQYATLYFDVKTRYLYNGSNNAGIPVARITKPGDKVKVELMTGFRTSMDKPHTSGAHTFQAAGRVVAKWKRMAFFGKHQTCVDAASDDVLGRLTFSGKTAQLIIDPYAVDLAAIIIATGVARYEFVRTQGNAAAAVRD